MADGRQASVYVRKATDDAVQRHMERTGRSYSAALRDLVKKGDTMAGMEDAGRMVAWTVKHEGEAWHG